VKRHVREHGDLHEQHAESDGIGANELRIRNQPDNRLTVMV